jgi:hypothetical protein
MSKSILMMVILLFKIAILKSLQQQVPLVVPTLMKEKSFITRHSKALVKMNSVKEPLNLRLNPFKTKKSMQIKTSQACKSIRDKRDSEERKENSLRKNEPRTSWTDRSERA